MKAALPAGLYGMVDPTLGDPRAQLDALGREGVGVVQLRCKGWGEDALLALAAYARARVELVIVNDHVRVAREAGAWVHLGQEDGPAPADVPYGRSCHRLDEVEALPRGGAPGAATLRYIGFGPVFGTATKDTGYGARGVELLAAAVRASPVPVVAIGGIAPTNVGQVAAAGAWGWAVIAGVWAAPDPAAAIHALQAARPLTPSTR